jgi:hypothetical protein
LPHLESGDFHRTVKLMLACNIVPGQLHRETKYIASLLVTNSPALPSVGKAVELSEWKWLCSFYLSWSTARVQTKCWWRVRADVTPNFKVNTAKHSHCCCSFDELTPLQERIIFMAIQRSNCKPMFLNTMHLERLEHWATHFNLSSFAGLFSRGNPACNKDKLALKPSDLVCLQSIKLILWYICACPASYPDLKTLFSTSSCTSDKSLLSCTHPSYSSKFRSETLEIDAA